MRERFIFTLIFSVLLGLPCFAQAEVLASLGTQLVFETESSGRAYDKNQPISLRAGYRFPWADLYAEYSSVQESDGTEMVKVSRKHQELLGWGRHLFMKRWKFRPYGAAGLGLQSEKVDTALGAEVAHTKGEPKGLLAAALGGTALVSKHIDIQVESRLTHVPAEAVKTRLSFGFFVGAVF